MAMTPGTRLGSYEIAAPIGAGGMGEVYRARDTRLDREVAIKVLPPALAVDADRLARFEREAKALASLNHPNIAQIFGIEEAGGQRAFVMELVEGVDLSALVTRGPVAPADVLRIAAQITDALEAAHEAGIVHRDLKPANIMVGANNTVKVLDFGLAKAVDPAAASGVDLMNSPTMTARATQMGIIIGTAAYMSPEQARGQDVDKRSDIWAFGVILFELLTGTRLFEGQTVSDTLASVLRQEVDWGRLPNETPPALVTLIRRCLEREPLRRLRDIGDARFDLAAAAEPRTTDAAESAAGRRAWWPLLALAAITVAALAFAFSGWRAHSDSAPAQPTYLSIALPADWRLVSVPAVTRDGRRLAFVASDGVERPQLWVRDLDEPESRLLENTEDATSPFFSPDGQWIAYYTPTHLCKVRASGGAPVRLATSSGSFGGTWTDAGRIVFKRTWNGGLFIIDENGGEADSLIAPQGDQEYAYVWPQAVPGTSDIMYVSWGTDFRTWRLDSATKESQVVAPDWWRRFGYVDGYLVSADGGEIKALKLAEVGETRGETATLVGNVEMGGESGGILFDVSQNGVLAYVAAQDDGCRLAFVDRSGRSTTLQASDDNFNTLRLSPDGRRAVARGGAGIVVVDLGRGTVTPLAPELRGQGAQLDPVWSPDGRSVTFGANKSGNWDIYRKSANGAGEIEAILAAAGDQQPETIAPDGSLLFRESDPRTGTDLWLLPPDGEARPWLTTEANEYSARFSPDGRLVAYVSDTSGRNEVYVQSRDGTDERTQVSVKGGGAPVWSPRGDRLYFRQVMLLMQVDVSTTDGLRVGAPEQVFDPGWTMGSYDIMPDGERFLAVEYSSDSAPARIDLLLNWPVLLTEAETR